MRKASAIVVFPLALACLLGFSLTCSGSMKGVATRTMSYGVVPQGFTEAAGARELAPGIDYHAIGFAPNAVGAVDFQQ